MALVACPECSRQVSDVAAQCPGCAFPMSALHAGVPSDAAPRAGTTAAPPMALPTAVPAPARAPAREGDTLVAHLGSSVITVRHKAGAFSHQLAADVDGHSALSTKISSGRGSSMLSAGGRPVEIRWMMSEWGTVTIVVLDGVQVVASRGKPKDVAVLSATVAEHPRQASATGGLIALLVLTAAVLFAAVVPVRSCPGCHGTGYAGVVDEVIGEKHAACRGDGKQTLWEILRASL